MGITALDSTINKEKLVMFANKMNILHIGNIRNIPHNGVCVVVPKHLEAQSMYANVALLNLDDFVPLNSKNSYLVFNSSKFNSKIQELPHPFNAPDLVVFHEIYWPKYIAISKYLRKKGIPYIILPHGSLTRNAQSIKKFKKTIGNKLAFDKFIDNARAIHYLSNLEKFESTKRDIPAIVASNGIDLPDIRKKKFSKKGLKLIYIGRIDIFVKGLDRLIEVARHIKEVIGVGVITITIAGTDSNNNKEVLNKLIDKYMLGGVIKIEPPLYGESKIDYLIEHDCFIQLSRSEGQPMGLLEAMGLGLPPIATNGTSLAEVISNNNLGYAVSDNPKEIFETIYWLNNNKATLKTSSENCVKYIHEKHNWNMIGQNTLIEYSKFLHGKTS